MTKGRVRIGLSGWSYRHWRGDFYPAGLPASRELEYTIRHFSTLELNRTFYSLVTPAAYRRWYGESPAGFCWSVKGSRFITHNKKLAGVEGPLANFFASGVLELREKLGPILWQLSASLRPNLDRLDKFLRQLPRDTQRAIDLARGHTMPEREMVVETDYFGPLRHVLEIRHPDWFIPEVAEIVRAHGVALAFSHSSRWPLADELTSDFIYVRLHGPRQLYASAYTDVEMSEWAERVEGWANSTRDVYVYFDNDTGGHAPRQATHLLGLVSQRLAS